MGVPVNAVLPLNSGKYTHRLRCKKIKAEHGQDSRNDENGVTDNHCELEKHIEEGDEIVPFVNRFLLLLLLLLFILLVSFQYTCILFFVCHID